MFCDATFSNRSFIEDTTAEGDSKAIVKGIW